MRIAIGIPTYGRAAIVLETLAELGKQSRPADRIVVCYARDDDVPASGERPPNVSEKIMSSGNWRSRMPPGPGSLIMM